MRSQRAMERLESICWRLTHVLDTEGRLTAFPRSTALNEQDSQSRVSPSCWQRTSQIFLVDAVLSSLGWYRLRLDKQLQVVLGDHDGGVPTGFT
jgi:hypothetical protein